MFPFYILQSCIPELWDSGYLNLTHLLLVFVLVIFLFNSFSFSVAGYLRVLVGFCCPHLSMYSFCSVCEDVGVSVFSFQFLIIKRGRVLLGFLLSSSVHVFFFCLMDNKRSCLLAALVNKDNNTFLSYHYLGSIVMRCTPFNNSLFSFLERCFVAVMFVAVACVIDAMVVFLFAFLNEIWYQVPNVRQKFACLSFCS